MSSLQITMEDFGHIPSLALFSLLRHRLRLHTRSWALPHTTLFGLHYGPPRANNLACVNAQGYWPCSIRSGPGPRHRDHLRWGRMIAAVGAPVLPPHRGIRRRTRVPVPTAAMLALPAAKMKSARAEAPTARPRDGDLASERPDDQPAVDPPDRAAAVDRSPKVRARCLEGAPEGPEVRHVNAPVSVDVAEQPVEGLRGEVPASIEIDRDLVVAVTDSRPGLARDAAGAEIEGDCGADHLELARQ